MAWDMEGDRKSRGRLRPWRLSAPELRSLRLMDSWIVVGPPRQFDQASDGSDIDVGWAWGIARREEQRTVAVLVAGGRLHDPCLPDECRRCQCRLLPSRGPRRVAAPGRPARHRPKLRSQAS